jgi:hypothetical protein
MANATDEQAVLLVGGRFHWHAASIRVGVKRFEISGSVYSAVLDPDTGSVLCYRFESHMMKNRRELGA